MPTAYLSLGSNQGDRCQNLQTARGWLAEAESIRITGVSSVYETEPWGKKDQDDFLNQVLAIETTLEPVALLHLILEIENRMGRRRQQRWGPRIIDIDIILFGQEIISTEELIIPHPYLRERAFVLVPLLEVWPQAILPSGEKLDKILNHLIKNPESGCIKKVTYDKMSQRKSENGCK